MLALRVFTIRAAAVLLALICLPVRTYSADAGSAELDKAYRSLLAKDYDRAIAQFRAGLAQQQGNAMAHKDLAYTLLKTGDAVEARDQFEAALKLDAHDDHAALEYAFLCYETKKPIEARRMFNRLREHGATEGTKKTAEDAFRNIDQPLADGIARWREAIGKSPNPNDPSTFSAHWELAQLAEQRDELDLAAEQYEVCRQLKPKLASLWLDLARVWQQLNRTEDARSALITAMWSSDSRTAERAHEALGNRYPYVYEFQKALVLDAQNTLLRRELAYLLLQMHRDAEAIQEFEKVVALDPSDRAAADQLAQLRGDKKFAQRSASAPPPASDAKTMAAKSLALGYTKDAVKYYQQAIEQNPDDPESVIGLAWAYNASGDDHDAIPLFNRARKMENPKIAADAEKAYHNLTASAQPTTTVWAFPIYSSRWKDTFGYGQAKERLPFFANSPVQFYASMRFIGDTRETMPGASPVNPTYLSESAVIAGLGASTRTWHHLLAWAEAGESISYLPNRTDVGRATPDYRGGLNFTKGFGQMLGARRSGLFFETTGDAVFISRFDKDWLFYSQNRAGRTFRLGQSTSLQLVANTNFISDTKSQYWANTMEVGPGLRLKLPGMPKNAYLLGDYLLGYYTRPDLGPPTPRYHDIRIGLWYAFSR
jgi:tetratricopeptide (TPR) repeat protein